MPQSSLLRLFPVQRSARRHIVSPSLWVRRNSTVPSPPPPSPPPSPPSPSPPSSSPGASPSSLPAAEAARQARLTPGTPEWDQPPPPDLTPEQAEEELRIRAEARGTPPGGMSWKAMGYLLLGSTALWAAMVYGRDHLPFSQAVSASPLSPQWQFDQQQEAMGLPSRRLTEEEERTVRARQQFRRLQLLAAQMESLTAASGGNAAPALDQDKHAMA